MAFATGPNASIPHSTQSRFTNSFLRYTATGRRVKKFWCVSAVCVCVCVLWGECVVWCVGVALTREVGTLVVCQVYDVLYQEDQPGHAHVDAVLVQGRVVRFDDRHQGGRVLDDRLDLRHLCILRGDR